MTCVSQIIINIMYEKDHMINENCIPINIGIAGVYPLQV